MANGPLYEVTFDPATVAKVSAMSAMVANMPAFYSAAMHASVNYVKDQASGFAPVITGNLRRGLRAIVDNPMQGRVGVVVSVPYARRRELGFSGMRDSLGRYYPHDPGSFYLRRGLDASLPFIQSAFATEADLAIRTVTTAV